MEAYHPSLDHTEIHLWTIPTTKKRIHLRNRPHLWTIPTTKERLPLCHRPHLWTITTTKEHIHLRHRLSVDQSYHQGAHSSMSSSNLHDHHHPPTPNFGPCDQRYPFSFSSY